MKKLAVAVLVLCLCVCSSSAVGERRRGEHPNADRGAPYMYVRHFFPDVLHNQRRQVGDGPTILTEMVLNNGTVVEWFKGHPWIYAVIGGAVLLVVIAIVVGVCLGVYFYRRRGPRHKRLGERASLLGGAQQPPGRFSRPAAGRTEIGVDEELNRQKRRQLTQDREKAVMAVNFFLRNAQQYQLEERLSDMGSRIQKYWFKVAATDGDSPPMLLSIAPVSQRCPLKLDQSTVRTVNGLLRVLQAHPYLHHVREVEFFQGQVIIVQPFSPRGSLKDVIYRATCSTDWSMKYSRRSRGLSAEKVATFGRQILEAMVFLKKKGFPVLGHVQSGNVFVGEDGVCRVGGYENTLLGYKTRLYKTCKEHMELMDVIMFGHVLFEMACGYELTALSPGEQEYNSVKNDQVKAAMQFVFTEGFPHSLEQILASEFFQSGKAPQLKGFDPSKVKFTSDMKALLKQVAKGKAQKQREPRQSSRRSQPHSGDDTLVTPISLYPAQSDTPVGGQGSIVVHKPSDVEQDSGPNNRGNDESGN